MTSLHTPISSSVVSEQSTHSIIETLLQLYDNNLFLQAYQTGVNELGPVAEWPTQQLQLLAARILSQLGYLRRADALILRLARSNPEDTQVFPYYLRVIHRRRGPLAALNELKRLRMPTRDSKELERELLLEEADIYCRYRDFSTAENCLIRAKAIKNDNYLSAQFIHLKSQEDKYSEALTLAQSHLAQTPDYRPFVQSVADLLQLLDRSVEAIDVLRKPWQESESWWMGRQFFNLLVEAGRYDEAEQCLLRLSTILPIEDPEITRGINAMKADLLCAQEKYIEALDFLEQKSLFGSRLKESIRSAHANAQRKILYLPFIRQANMTCAPASLASVSAYWGQPEDHQTIVDAICYGGTQDLDERKWALEKGWFVTEFELNFTALKSLIDRGIPVLLATVEPGSAHLQIIVGYDESMDVYLLRDPYHPRLQEFLISETEQYYASNGPRCMIIAPPHLKTQIEQLALPHADLFDELFELSMQLENNQRDQAAKTLERIQQRTPDTRISFVCERKLALYDNDEVKILAATEKLLQKYPNDVNFQLSKITSLSALGAGSKSLEYLENVSREANTHMLLLSRLANELRKDHRRSVECAQLYQYLLKRNPLHVETLYGFAGMLWDKQQHAESYMLYRFCACLEDTNEHYAESFFKAARFQRDTAKAIDFLTDRFARFADKSSGPAISLFNALESLNREVEAFQYLERGLSLLPDDSELLLFAARKFAFNGNADHAAALLQQAQKLARASRYYATAAEFYENALESEKALQASRSLLAITPLNQDANQIHARLLATTGQARDATDFILGQLLRYPANRMLQYLLLTWTDEDDLGAKADIYAEICNAHPTDYRAFREYASVLEQLGRKDQALQMANIAVAINNADYVNFGYLGDVLLSRNEREQARTTFKQAIRLNCDYGFAMARLIDCSFDHQQKLSDLRFVHDELMTQVSYGEGIISFQELATRYFEAQDVQAFLTCALDQRPDLWQSWVAMTIHLRNQNKLDEALAYANEAVTRFPLLPRVHAEKSEVLRTRHQVPAAIEAMEKALELSPSWVYASNSLCDLYEHEGNFDAAIALQEQAVRRSPLDPSPLGYLSDLYLRCERKEDAKAALERAVARDNGYSYAWQQLNDLAEQEGTKQGLLKRMREILNRVPHKWRLLQAYCDVSELDEHAIKYLERFIQEEPHHLNACIKLIRAHVEGGEFSQAHALTSDTYWQNNPPLAIRSNKAWIYAREENLVKACAIMEDVAQNDPNYYDAWRYLAIWHEEMGNKERVAQALAHCARLYPHDSNVMCFCSEKLKAVNGPADQVTQYLRHAFELTPSQQYNALTYIDDLIENKRITEAQEALSIALQFNKNGYVYYRGLEIALAQNQQSLGLEYFEKTLRSGASEGYILVNFWHKLGEHKLQEKAATCLRTAIRDLDDIDPIAGRCLAEHELATLPMRKFEAALLNRDWQSDFDERYLEAYLRKLIDLQKVMPNDLETTLHDFIKRDSKNWGLYGYCLYQLNGREAQCNRFLDGLEKQDDAEAWALFHGSMAQRWVGQHSRGQALMKRAAELPEDNYRKDILVWRYYDLLSAGKPVAQELLLHLDSKELEGISRYIIVVNRVLVLLQNSDFVESYQYISPLLRECQRRVQSLSRNRVIKSCKEALRQQLRDSIPQLPTYQKLLWRWRLSNHF